MENNLVVATAETELTDPAILALQKAMDVHAVNMVVIGYEGGGDSGSVSNIECTDAGWEALKGSSVQTNIARLKWDRDTGYRWVTQDETLLFCDALEELLWSAVTSSGHGGWENNEGGQGSLSLPAYGQAVLEHTNFWEEHSTVCDLRWSADDSLLSKQISALQGLMDAHNWHRIDGTVYLSDGASDSAFMTVIVDARAWSEPEQSFELTVDGERIQGCAVYPNELGDLRCAFPVMGPGGIAYSETGVEQAFGVVCAGLLGQAPEPLDKLENGYIEIEVTRRNAEFTAREAVRGESTYSYCFGPVEKEIDEAAPLLLLPSADQEDADA